MLKEFDISSLASDPKGLQQLKYTNTEEQTPKTIQAAAKQFEAIFMNMMLKSMRDANSGFGDSLFDNEQSKLYRSMLDQQLSSSLTNGYNLGLAEALVRQLTATAGYTTPTPPNPTDELNRPARRKPAPVSTDGTVQNAHNPPSQKIPQDINSVTQSSFATPEEFVEKLWPLAKNAGESLKVSPYAILAQAALETGWGRYIIKRSDGSNSFNLFGIKANHSWQGDKAVVSTLEYHDGIARRERAQFRAYPSYNESFNDYVSFLKENPRYAEVLKAGRSSQKFATALQEAGYATDPAYARKIMAVMKNSAFSTVL